MPTTPNCCGTVTRKLDAHGSSTTFGCFTCHDGYLVIEPNIQIRLPDFVARRGPAGRPLDDREFAESLVHACSLDIWPSPAVCADFGIVTHKHLGAVQDLVQRGRVDAYQLDRALGSGTAMSSLVSALGIENAPMFVTAYDAFYDLSRNQREGGSLATSLIPEGVKLPPLYSREQGKDPVAVLKWFTPDSSWTWYVLEYDPVERLAFALVNGHEVEMGYVSVGELEQVRGPMGLPIERDLFFEPTPVSVIKSDLEIGRDR